MQLESEHERIVADLRMEILQLQQRYAPAPSGANNATRGKGTPDESQMADTTDMKDAMEPTQLTQPTSTSDPVDQHVLDYIEARATTLGHDFDKDDPIQQEHYLQMLLYVPKWCSRIGISPPCLKGCWTWWHNSREPTRTGRFVECIESKAFQAFVLTMILLNTIFIVLVTDEDMQTSMSGPRLADTSVSNGKLDNDDCTKEVHSDFATQGELLFAVFYASELLLKLMAHRQYYFINSEWRWNSFDAFLVFTSVLNYVTEAIANGDCGKGLNLTFLRALRILKSARILRMVRVVRFLRELRLMVDCIMNSAFHLVWCVLLIVMILLMFALLIVQGLQSYVDKASDAQRLLIAEGFDTVASAMVSLFMATTGGADWSEQYYLVADAGLGLRVVYLFFIAFFTIVAWNIVMSTFVEKACRLAMPDLEETAMEKCQAQQAYAMELNDMLLARLDVDKDGMITLDEFRIHLEDPEVVRFFLAREINVTDAELFFHMLSAIHGTDNVDVKTFTKAILRLRGSSSAIDMQSFHFDVKNLHAECFNKISRLEDRLSTMMNKMVALSRVEETLGEVLLHAQELRNGIPPQADSESESQSKYSGPCGKLDGSIGGEVEPLPKARTSPTPRAVTPRVAGQGSMHHFTL